VKASIAANDGTTPIESMLTATSAVTMAMVRQTAMMAQRQLLSALVEANAIYAYYIDTSAPNELNIDGLMRKRVRDSLDNIIQRALIPNSMLLTLLTPPSHQQQLTNGASATPASSQISSKGVFVSSYLSVEDARQLEMELRGCFNEVQDAVVKLLHVNSFTRFRASDLFLSLVASLKGFTIEGQLVMKKAQSAIQVVESRSLRVSSAPTMASALGLAAASAAADQHESAIIRQSTDSPILNISNSNKRRIAPEPIPVTATVPLAVAVDQSRLKSVSRNNFIHPSNSSDGAGGTPVAAARGAGDTPLLRSGSGVNSTMPSVARHYYSGSV
jgi:hypothetical protein